MSTPRIGQGYDVHRLVEGRPLVLGGVTVPYEKGLLGHSDADVLLHAVRLLADQGFTIGNVDVTLVAQRPKIAPFIPQMRENIAADLQTSLDAVNIKATTEEHLGFTGSGEGMAAQAVALIFR